MLLGGRGERRALAARPRRRRPPGSSAPGPAGAGRTLGETRRNVCRVRENCESAEAGTEGTGETRGDG
jgi:hypothetical protein